MNEHVQLRAAYFYLMSANGAAHVYRVALEAGLLDRLAEKPQSADELAATCQCDARATLLVLEALRTIYIVAKVDGRWSLTPLSASLLLGGYRQIGDQYWAHLPNFLKTGQPWIHMDDTVQSEVHYQAQAASLAWMLTPAADAAAEALESTLQGKIARILDLGAGSAIWSLTIARRNAGATVTAIDWPAVLQVAQVTAARLGLADRLTTIPGNYHDVELPESEFDLAILGNVTHLESPDGNRALLAKSHRALKPGGRVAIFDVLPGQPVGDVNRTLYTLGLALRTRAGHVYAPNQLESLLTESGFGKPTLINLPVPPHAVGLLLAPRQ